MSGGDLAGVAQVAVEGERHEVDAGPPRAVEDPLAVVAEDRDPPGGGIGEGGEQRRPPRVGEVLGLVDDEGVEALLVRQPAGEVEHPGGQDVLPVRRPGVVRHRLAPAVAERVVRHRLDPPARRLGLVGEPPVGPGRQPVGVADERDPGAALGPAPRLLQGEVRLAAAGAADHLVPRHRADEVEQGVLGAGELVGVRGQQPLARSPIAARVGDAAEDLRRDLDRSLAGRALGLVREGAAQHVVHPPRGLGQVALGDHAVARQPGGGVFGADVGVGQGREVRHPRLAELPAIPEVALHEVALALGLLVEVDDLVALGGLLAPHPVSRGARARP